MVGIPLVVTVVSGASLLPTRYAASPAETTKSYRTRTHRTAKRLFVSEYRKTKIGARPTSDVRRYFSTDLNVFKLFNDRIVSIRQQNQWLSDENI